MKHRHSAGSKWQANATNMSPTLIHRPFPGTARDLFLPCCPAKKKKLFFLSRPQFDACCDAELKLGGEKEEEKKIKFSLHKCLDVMCAVQCASHLQR
ncbi:hypothetical protein HOY80DRAFT_925877 [Tuber brumale]|nr:hypothetical protein HOY80DRAFT_925877 [Tuber brumale]